MATLVFETNHFSLDARGPSLDYWIHDFDLVYPAGEAPYMGGRPTGRIVGAQHDQGWILFHKLVVLEIGPMEHHSRWHEDDVSDDRPVTGIWEVQDSDWPGAYYPECPSGHSPLYQGVPKHFVIEFYDEMVEVVCGDLITGPGRFDLKSAVESDPRLAGYYVNFGDAESSRGNIDRAVEFYLRCLGAEGADPESVESARQRIRSIRTGFTANSEQYEALAARIMELGVAPGESAEFSFSENLDPLSAERLSGPSPDRHGFGTAVATRDASGLLTIVMPIDTRFGYVFSESGKPENLPSSLEVGQQIAPNWWTVYGDEKSTGMIEISAAGNVEVPCYLALRELGYSVTSQGVDEEEFWIAEREGRRHVAADPLQLLGLAKLAEMRGENWQAPDDEIDRFMEEFYPE